MSATKKLRAENEQLRLAIHRIAVEKGMWSVLGNNVIVTVEPTLTEAEREAVRQCILHPSTPEQTASTLRKLLERCPA